MEKSSFDSTVKDLLAGSKGLSSKGLSNSEQDSDSLDLVEPGPLDQADTNSSDGQPNSSVLEFLEPARKPKHSQTARVKKDWERLPRINSRTIVPTLMHQFLGLFRTWGVSFFAHVVILVTLGLITIQIVSKESVQIVGQTIPVDALENFDSQANLQIQSTDSSLFESSSVTVQPKFDSVIFDESEAHIEIADNMDVSNILNGPRFMANLTNEGAGFGQAGQGNGEGEGEPASFYGISATGQSFVFVVDRSMSMDGQKWLSAQTELIRSISELSTEQSFFVNFFNHESTPIFNLKGKRERLLVASPEEIEKAREWIYEIGPFGNTSPIDSMKQALRLNPDVIFLLSDGIFRDGTLEYLRSHNQDRGTGKPNIVVHTIAYGDQAGAALLEQISIENGGKFKIVQ